MGQDQWRNPAIVSNAMELAKRELPRLAGKVKNIHMCFTTDPFMVGYPEVADLTLRLISLINDKGIPVTTLTKGVYPARALRHAFPENSYGITIVSLHEEFRKRMEPGAAPIADRLEALKRLHHMGKRTWVSIEPYPTPNIIDQDLRTVLEKVSFVDRIIFGRLNYSALTRAYPLEARFYADAAGRVVRFCKSRRIQCHIKSGTVRGNLQGGSGGAGGRRVRAAL
jgi:DNA repair photolyase